MTVLEPDELVTAIHFPDWPQGHITLFREVAQRPGDFALVGLVGALAVESGQDRPRRARLVRHGADADEGAAGRGGAARPNARTRLTREAIAELAVADTAPFDDHHASAEYRRTVGRRIFARTLREALGIREAA